MGRSTPENTLCDTSPMLPNRQGAKRMPLRENVLVAMPHAHQKLSTYFGPPSADSIRDSK